MRRPVNCWRLAGREMQSRRCAMRRCCSPSIPSSSMISASPASRSAGYPRQSRRCSGPSRLTGATPMPISDWESPWRSWATLPQQSSAYDRATKLLPSLTEAWFRAGALVYELGHRDEAIGCFRRAAATGGKTSFGRLGKARALLIEDRNQEAEQVLRETLVADPTNAMAYDLLGSLLSEFGRFDEARACFERAIAIAPLLAGSYYDLVRCRPVTRDDDGLLATDDSCPGHAGAGSGATPAPSPRDRQGGGRSWRLRLGHAAFRCRRCRAPGLYVVRLGRVLHRDRPADCPLHTRIDGAGARTRQQRCNAGADHRHAAVRHNSRRADRLHASRGRGRWRVEFLERARGGSGTVPARPGTRSRSSPRRRQIILACCARSRRRRRE